MNYKKSLTADLYQNSFSSINLSHSVIYNNNPKKKITL